MLESEYLQGECARPRRLGKGAQGRANDPVILDRIAPCRGGTQATSLQTAWTDADAVFVVGRLAVSTAGPWTNRKRP